MLWFCVDLPALGLEVCARRMLDEDHPAVLVQDNRVIACNTAASDSGVAIGSSLATAHSLSHRLVHFCRDVTAERERLRFLADAAYRFSAGISVQEPSAILLEVSGSLRLFGGLYGLKRGLISLFRELGHRTAIGIAHTPLAALALARARGNPELPRWPAANDVKTSTLKSLRRVSLRHTEFDSDTVERFSNMGIETLGQVFRLPTAELGRRFGPKLLDYLERLSGQRPDPRICITPAADFTTELHFLQSISNKEALAFPMQRLAQDLGNWLIGRQLGVIRISWRFAPFNSKATTMEIEFAQPQQSKQALLSISRLKLDVLDLPDEVLSLQLSSIRLAPWQAESNLLFARTEHAGHSPTELIDQFKARLGDGVCSGITANDNHRPESAWKPTAPDVRPHRIQPPGLQSSGRQSSQAAAVRRPLWLLNAPKPAQRRHLALLRGPERIDVGWWASANVYDSAQRDYFVARHADGSQCWVFVDGNGEWFIHGYFA
jgi:protein ImuB